MKNIYHSDIYKFEKPVNSYWEDSTKENFNLEKLTKDINSEVVVIGGGYTGLLCAINLIENYNLDVILLDAGKVGWGASSRNGGFCSFPPIKTSFKKLQKIYGKEETKKFFKNSIEGSSDSLCESKDYFDIDDIILQEKLELLNSKLEYYLSKAEENGDEFKKECIKSVYDEVDNCKRPNQKFIDDKLEYLAELF